MLARRLPQITTKHCNLTPSRFWLSLLKGNRRTLVREEKNATRWRKCRVVAGRKNRKKKPFSTYECRRCWREKLRRRCVRQWCSRYVLWGHMTTILQQNRNFGMSYCCTRHHQNMSLTLWTLKAKEQYLTVLLVTTMFNHHCIALNKNSSKSD